MWQGVQCQMLLEKGKKRSVNFLRLMLFGLIIKNLFRLQDQIHVENAVVYVFPLALSNDFLFL